jgi:hypothetical protein
VSSSLLELVSVDPAHLSAKRIVRAIGIDVRKEPVQNVKQVGWPRCRIELVEAKKDNLELVSRQAPIHEKPK